MRIIFLQNIKVFELLNDLLKGFIGVLPNLVGAVLLFIIGWILAKVMSKFIRKILSKTGIDKFAERFESIDIVHKSKIKMVPSKILAKILYYVIFLIFAIAATDQLNMPAVSSLVSEIIQYIPKLLTAGIVLVFGVVIADALRKVVHTALESFGIPSAKIIAGFVFYFILIAVFMSALGQAEIEVSFFEKNITVLIAAGAFAFALGYGLASRDQMANFLASFYSKKKIHIGDDVKIDGVRGKIIKIDNNSFTLKTETGKIVFPINIITTQRIEFFDIDN